MMNLARGVIGIVGVCVIISDYTIPGGPFLAQDPLEQELQNASASAKLEELLKTYPNQADRIVPRLESLALEESRKRGGKETLAMNDISSQDIPAPIADLVAKIPEGVPARGTINQKDGLVYMLSSEFPGDGVVIWDAYEVVFASRVKEYAGLFNEPEGNFGLRTLLFADGSVHRFAGMVKLHGYLINGTGDRLNRLTFGVVKGIGYVYLRGQGSVTLKDGTEHRFPSCRQAHSATDARR